MFENFKAGNILNKLQTLSTLESKIKKEKKLRGIIQFLPNCTESDEGYITSYGYKFSVKNYEFTLGDITYGFEEVRNSDSFVYIKVKDIIIYHNRSGNSCQGLFEDVEGGWNHNSPKEMLDKIKEGSKIIDKYIKEVKFYLKCKGMDTKHAYEKTELERIFCKKL